MHNEVKTSSLSPRPIKRQRLEKLLRGLLQRMATASQRTEERIGAIQQQLAEVERHHQEQLSQLEVARHLQQVTTVTAWDEQRSERWDSAESLCYRTAASSEEQERQLKAAAKAEIDQVKSKADDKCAELDRQYQALVDAAKKRCEDIQGKFGEMSRSCLEIQQAADLSLARHSLSTPRLQTEMPLEKPVNAQHSLKLVQASVVSAGQLSGQLQNLPLGRLFSSVTPWLICLVVFVGCTLLMILLLQWNLVFSISFSAGITCLLMLATLLGVRPWLRRAAENLYPQLQAQLGLAAQYRKVGEELAVKERDAECERLIERFRRERKEVANWHQSQVERMRKKVQSEISKLWENALAESRQVNSQLEQELDEVDRSFKCREQNEAFEADRELQMLKEVHLRQRGQLLDQIQQESQQSETRLRRAVEIARHHLDRMGAWYTDRFLDWTRLIDQEREWPVSSDSIHVPLGTVDLDQLWSADSAREAGFPSMGLSELKAPVLFSPLDDSYLVIHGDPKRLAVQRLTQSILLRGLTQFPPGKSQVCVVDPSGLGRDFGWLMALGDDDPSLVTHRVWTQPTHIARQLQILVDGAEDFIQKALRNRYSSILEYNRDAAGMSEPYRLIIWYGLPAGLDDQCWKLLQSLCDSGARCGIIPILIVDHALGWNDPKFDWLRLRGVHLQARGEVSFCLKTENSHDLVLVPEDPPLEADVDRLIRELAHRAQRASRVEVPLSQLLGIPSAEGFRLAQFSQLWSADSSASLDIPVGQAGVGKVQSLKLGVGTAQHAVIAGKTGSGKSSLLHAIITSALLKYSPESLRLVLLDFKKGVEFQVYNESQIPHADIIGIESHREFGLSALQRIDECLQLRGEMFRSSGVQDIAGWNRAHPERILPRVLLVIDEFQELFIEDDKISHSCSMILDRIVRQGRSFGVHAVMSSQTLAGAYSLPRSTLNQMSVRIALVCDVSDAQIIFSDDNPAAARLKHPGSAIYNDAGGRIEGNQPMQVGWVDQQTQVNWLDQLPKGYRNSDPTTNRLGRTVVYDGNRPARWRPESVDLAVDHAHREGHGDALWCAVGDSVTINPAVVFPLTSQTGRNALLVGPDDALGASVMNLVTHSFVKAAIGRGLKPRLVGIVGAKPVDSHTLELGDRWAKLPCRLEMVDRLGAAETLRGLYQLLQERIAQQAPIEQPVLLNLIHLGRLTSLRREEEFSFDTSAESPDKWLEGLLRDGPSHGIHVIIWAESYSVVNRWLQRSALRELEIRLLMQMSPSDSSNLMDSIAAAHLGERIMLLYDEASGVEAKFRPFDFHSLIDLNQWVQGWVHVRVCGFLSGNRLGFGNSPYGGPPEPSS